MTDKSREMGFKLLTLAVAIGGSVIGSYTAAKVEMGKLSSRMDMVERQVSALETRKLDVKLHDELVNQLSAMQARNDSAHQDIYQLLLQINRRR